MDRIYIRDLSARCIIGINDEERREKQDVLINLTILADLKKAGKSDEFEDSVDFRALKKRILSKVETSTYHLIEALAEAIADICLEEKSVLEVQVTVDKPYALLIARSVAVEITRKRQD